MENDVDKMMRKRDTMLTGTMSSNHEKIKPGNGNSQKQNG